MAGVAETAGELLEALDAAVIGYGREKRLLVATLLARGHVLLEGVPGVAKTTMVRALARLLGLLGREYEIGGIRYRGYSRIQFTPDLMPGDVTGSLIYNPRRLSFEPRLGPIFAYIVLADEVNRATPRTQSALLEAMQERQVTIGGYTYPLEDRARGKFFLVVATQNPIEQEGTYPLPEAQLDRFSVRLIIGYPYSLEEEAEILRLHAGRLREPLEDLEPVVDPAWVVRAQAAAAAVKVPDHVISYIALLVRLTRPSVNSPIARLVEVGASPRAGIALLRVAQALALLDGESHVSLRHVDEALFPVLNHRLVPRLEAILEKDKPQHEARYEVLAEALDMARRAARGEES